MLYKLVSKWIPSYTVGTEFEYVIPGLQSGYCYQLRLRIKNERLEMVHSDVFEASTLGEKAGKLFFNFIIYRVALRAVPSCAQCFTKLRFVIYRVVLHTIPSSTPCFTMLLFMLAFATVRWILNTFFCIDIKEHPPILSNIQIKAGTPHILIILVPENRCQLQKT